MANVTNKNPIKIDVVGTAVDLPDVRRIKSFEWVSTEGDAIAANDDLEIRHTTDSADSTGDFIFRRRASAASDDFSKDFGGDEGFLAHRGINVLIDGGELFIYS